MRLHLDCIVRLATMQDINFVTNLYNETISRCSKARLNMARNIRKNNTVILEYNNTKVGAYIYEINRFTNPITNKKEIKQCTWLQQIMVTLEKQKQGFGNLLLQHFLTITPDRYRLICNTNLEKFYSKYGFVIQEYTTKNNETRLIMIKQNI